MVFYLKYRPQKIEELDSKYVRERLFSVLSSDSIPHAFLFTGPKGLGKTSTARIVAKAVNCEAKGKKQEVRSKDKTKKKEKDRDSSFIIHDSSLLEPCNECQQCISITNGINLDVLEIDAASNRGIDEIRDLREKIRLAPASAHKKVYIIDEVHMLTTEAFNALLKTLEEPPSHVLFILCTTESHKVPSTIVSRCFQVLFKKATEEELIRSFKRIVEKEKIAITDEALVSVADLSDGSFRDGVKILEEVRTLSGESTITKEFVEEKNLITNISTKLEYFLKLLEDKDVKKSFVFINALVDEGINMVYFTEQLLSHLHLFLLRKVGVIESQEKDILSIEEIKKLIQVFSKAYPELKYAVIPQLPLELAILEWIDQTSDTGDRTSEIRNQRSDKNQSVVELTGKTNRVRTEAKSEKSAESETENVDFLDKLIDAVKLHNHSIAGVLRGCMLKSFDGKTLVIETNFKFHKDKLSEKKTIEMLEKTAEEVTGKKAQVLVELKES